MVVLGAIAMSGPGCSSGDELSCGAGTVESGGECVPDGAADAGAGSGGSAGFAGSAGAGGDGGASGQAGAEAQALCAKNGNCPTVAMVTVPWADPAKATYEMDAHETTLAEYKRFLADVEAGIVPDLSGGTCAEQEDYTQDDFCLDLAANDYDYDPENDDWPVVCIDWCSAQAYCSWAGKRLCGHNEELADNEWYNACSSQGTNEFGASLKTEEECSLPKSCEDASGLFNMTWGAAEWVDGCLEGDGNTERCEMGAGFHHTPGAQCHVFNFRGNSADGIVTLRCCR